MLHECAIYHAEVLGDRSTHYWSPIKSTFNFRHVALADVVQSTSFQNVGSSNILTSTSLKDTKDRVDTKQM